MIIPSRLLKDLFEERNETFPVAMGVVIGGSTVAVVGSGEGTMVGSMCLLTEEADDDGGTLMN